MTIHPLFLRIASLVPAVTVAGIAAVQMADLEEQIEQSDLYAPAFITLALVSAVVTIAAYVHVLTNRNLTIGERLRWAIFIFLGAIVAIPAYVTVVLRDRSAAERAP